MRTFADDDEKPSVVTYENTTCIRSTGKAILVRLEDGREKWVPQSVIHADSEVYEDRGTGKLVIKAWFAEKMK